MRAVIRQQAFKFRKVIKDSVQFIKKQIRIRPFLVPVGIEKPGVIALILLVHIGSKIVKRAGLDFLQGQLQGGIIPVYFGVILQGSPARIAVYDS